MFRRTRVLGLAAVVASLGFAIGTQPAQAAKATVAAVEGGGSISPGLSTTGTFQSVSFSGTAVGAAVVGNTKAAFTGVHCSFAGGSTAPETVATGAGHVNGTCSGSTTAGPAFISCSLNYSRKGGAVTTNGGCSYSIGGSSGSGSLTGAFNFVPTSANPTRSYLLQGIAKIS